MCNTCDVSGDVIRLCRAIAVILLVTFIALVFWSNFVSIEPEMPCVVVIPQAMERVQLMKFIMRIFSVINL